MAIVPVVARVGSGMKADVELLMVVKPARPAGERVATSAYELDGPSGPGPELVYQTPSEGTWMESASQAIDRMDEAARESMRDAAQTLRDAGLQVREKVLQDNDAAKAIVDYACRARVDMIAMSTHGRTGLRQAIQGSIAAGVVASGAAPVLLVRPKPRQS